MHTLFWKFFNTILDIVAPPRATEVHVRKMELEDLQYLARGESALPYKDTQITALVWELKYRANLRAAELGGAFLSEELMAIASEELGKPLLIPVPMHESRRHERGYNQTELLCKAALSVLNENEGQNKIFDYAPDILARVRATPPQQGLPKSERLKNINGSMRAEGPDAGRIARRVCVVVDDVTTTGATFEECKRVLKAAGARRVYCVALARS